ncbi:hypothetical protein ILUMI_04639 [Ignelater luminosus]|uniref:Uncharacterized protein n=1 Tax=Ignelater luminosus TaxID=2038154 RepID=A0A8K0GJE2_IGNLU|nr:hypothetical protein ILUMI_04639 [Ignelater luminosus]
MVLKTSDNEGTTNRASTDTNGINNDLENITSVINEVENKEVGEVQEIEEIDISKIPLVIENNEYIVNCDIVLTENNFLENEAVTENDSTQRTNDALITEERDFHTQNDDNAKIYKDIPFQNNKNECLLCSKSDLCEHCKNKKQIEVIRNNCREAQKRQANKML